MFESDRTMFEIYRDAGYSREYRVVYFTELNEHNKEQQINRAMAGEHFCDGFVSDRCKPAAKAAINGILDRLNRGERLDPAEAREILAGYAEP